MNTPRLFVSALGCWFLAGMVAHGAVVCVVHASQRAEQESRLRSVCTLRSGVYVSTGNKARCLTCDASRPVPTPSPHSEGALTPP